MDEGGTKKVIIWTTLTAGHFIFKGLSIVCQKAGEFGEWEERHRKRRETLKEGNKNVSLGSSSSLRNKLRRNK